MAITRLGIGGSSAAYVFTAAIVMDTVTLSGVAVRTRVAGLEIHDILNDAPNTCSLRFDGSESPQVGQALEVRSIQGGSVRLFIGQLQTVELTYEGGKNTNTVWACTAIDDTAKANWRRPFGTWTSISASTIADDIAADFAPGFTTAIEAGLPAVSITFDGGSSFIACLARLASAVGGYCKVEDNTIYLFIDDATTLPDPIDDSHPFLNDPPIQITTDASQLRTRVYGKGYGESVPADVSASDTILPLSDGAQFNPAGGRALVGTTADGAQSQQIAYTGLRLALPGTLVGPGAAPASAPAVALAAGSGVESGVHGYAQVWVTAAGKSLPSPIASIDVGTVAAPSSAPTAGAPSTGGSIDAGTYQYNYTNVTAAGETTPCSLGNQVTTTAQQAAPAVTPTLNDDVTGPSSMDTGAAYKWKFTFVRDSDGAETTPSTATASYIAVVDNQGALNHASLGSLPGGYSRRWYRTEGDGSTFKRTTDPVYSDIFGWIMSGESDASLGATAPSTNNTAKGTIAVTGIAVSPSALVTARKLYRSNGGTAKLVTTISNNTGTTYSDTTAQASLGADVPSSNTAVANQVTYARIAGPTGTTSREYYRTGAAGSQLKLLATLGDNTTVSAATDSAADASLGANVHTSDTSGLTQPSGQVNAGSTSLPTASAGPFTSGGGWVQLGGGQVVRYTGITGNSLTGVPASGAGSILTTVTYGSQAIPAASLTGVTGLALAVARGSQVHIFVQRDDTTAQAAHAARAGGDGIVEYLISDGRRGEASLIASCDADLALFAYPIVTVTYATRDRKSKSGKPVVVDLAVPFVNQTLTIQDVTITEIDIATGLAPRFSVRASSVRHSLESILRTLIGKVSE